MSRFHCLWLWLEELSGYTGSLGLSCFHGQFCCHGWPVKENGASSTLIPTLLINLSNPLCFPAWLLQHTSFPGYFQWSSNMSGPRARQLTVIVSPTSRVVFLADSSTFNAPNKERLVPVKCYCRPRETKTYSINEKMKHVSLEMSQRLEHTCHTMYDVFTAVVLFSLHDSLADVCSCGKDAQSTSFAVINTTHRLLGVNVHERHVSLGIRHPTWNLHLLMVSQDMVYIRPQWWHKRSTGICVGRKEVSQTRKQSKIFKNIKNVVDSKPGT